MLPRCLAVLLLASVAVRDVTFAAKLRLSLPERLDVTEGVSLTINCSFSPPPTDPNHVIVKWSVLPAFYSKNTPIGDVIQIYNSGVDVVGVGVAAHVGDVAKGDCSVRLRRVSAGLGPVIGCMVVCGRCNAEDVAVAREATLNVTVAARERRSVPILVPECLLMSHAVSAECRRGGGSGGLADEDDEKGWGETAGFANGVKVQTSGGHPDSAQCHKTTETSLGSPGASVTKTSFFS
ncbi:uncharacterized protein LOC142915963 isoform X1 [Petromyzon marinus]|uniref:uncharacterized protein LOC142913366 isoform X1 n=1 Tax=Petromyzon marinus TaxID=7757 RepID=UPI003F702155